MFEEDPEEVFRTRVVILGRVGHCADDSGADEQ